MGRIDHKVIALVFIAVLGASGPAAYGNGWGRGSEFRQAAEQRHPTREGFRNMPPDERQMTTRERFRDMSPEQRQQAREQFQQWKNQNPEAARQLREEARDRFQERWQRADPNRNGRITREQAARNLPGISQHFDEIDANHDGVITQDEVRAFRERRARERLGPGNGGDPRN
jgi:Ca2+-binding EF-hand superfamily protein